MVPEDPHMIVRLFADIGGTRAKADNFVFWAVQFVGMTIATSTTTRFGTAYRGASDMDALTGYSPDRCKVFLPHDGETNDRVFDVSYQSAFANAGYEVEVIPNQGRAQQCFALSGCASCSPNCGSMKKKCVAGLKALAPIMRRKTPAGTSVLGLTMMETATVPTHSDCLALLTKSQP